MKEETTYPACQCCGGPIPAGCVHVCPECADRLLEGEIADRIRSEDAD